MVQQRDAIKELSPPWLSSGNAEKYLYNFGLSEDVLLEKLNQGMKAHMPGLGDSSASPYIGLDRVMPQGPFEDDASYASRLQAAFDTWQRAGSRRAVMSQALIYVADYATETSAQRARATTVSCSSAGTWATWDTYYNTSNIKNAPAHARVGPANWDWDGTFLWWRAWLVVFLPSTSVVQPGPVFGAAGVTIGDSTLSIGFSNPSTFFDGYRALVRLWKSRNTYYPWLIFSFNVSDSIYSPNVASGSGNPDSTWAKPAVTVNGVAVSPYPSQSRFVDGTGIYDSNCTIQVRT